jgi:hypothetical protein
VAHITRTIELAHPVAVISQRWNEFEQSPRCPVAAVEARLRWRAEVLTFEPRGDGTRLTLRIDYDPAAGDLAVAHGLDGVLEGFRSFLAERLALAS